MALVDTDRIIHGTPDKRIQVAYNEMKESYTKESAASYYDVYSKEPLSAVLENSRIIFSEPFKGLDFYKSIVLDPSSCIFTSLESEIDKVEDYVESNTNKLPKDQLDLYNGLLTEMKAVSEKTKGTQVYAKYISENVDDSFEEKISSAIYNNKIEHDGGDKVPLSSLFEGVNNLCLITYLPYATEASSKAGEDANSDIAPLCSIIGDKDTDEFVEEVLCANRLFVDGAYHSALFTEMSRNNRTDIIKLASESVDDILQSKIKTAPVKISDVTHVTAESAVNSVFDLTSSLLTKAPNFLDDEVRNEVSAYLSEAADKILTIAQYELDVTETASSSIGYNILGTEGTDLSLEDTILAFTEKYADYIEAADEEDVSDEAIDNVDNDGADTGKKPEAPDAGSKQNKAMIKAMDKEAKYMDKRAAKEQKGLERRAAFKAKTAIPRSIVQRIQRDVNHLDELDEERRKNYLSKPGFRKKWFRNLKLAILYGGALTYKLTMLPIVMMCRHFSKQKDRRMQNELVRELDTEISIAEEKINDANANGDVKQKYRLMRIRDQLKAERTRVAVNSKYI